MMGKQRAGRGSDLHVGLTVVEGVPEVAGIKCLLIREEPESVKNAAGRGVPPPQNSLPGPCTSGRWASPTGVLQGPLSGGCTVSYKIPVMSQEKEREMLTPGPCQPGDSIPVLTAPGTLRGSG